jgi:mono/diheme cytochrome c family protein
MPAPFKWPALFRWVVGACVLCLASAPSGAEEPGDAAQGRTYAQAHCAECHGVERSRDDFSPNVDAPDFSEVANTPGMTARALAVWLQTPHPTMPNLMVPPEARDNVIAYIMGLKGAAKP